MHWSGTRASRHLCVAAFIPVVLTATVTSGWNAAKADVSFALYLGASQTRASDLHVVQRGRGNDATLRGVSWPGFPFRFEPYYGFRLTYWNASHPQTQYVLDFTHYKIYGKTEDVVEQQGTWRGVAFHDTAPAQNRVQSFEMTHGLNMLGAGILQQFTASTDGPYAGGGPVLYFPHSENRVDGVAGGDRFDFGGFGFQLHGTRARMRRRFAAVFRIQAQRGEADRHHSAGVCDHESHYGSRTGWD